jgi:CBS domain-containing protein
MKSKARKTTTALSKKKVTKSKKTAPKAKSARASSASVTKTTTSRKAAPASKSAKLKVKDIMQKTVHLMKPEDTIQQAAKKMHEKNVGCVFINKNEKLAGIVTDRDITIRAVSKGNHSGSVKLKDIMSPKILYCFDTDTVQNAAQNMAKNQIRRLPVLNKAKKLVGIISIESIAIKSAKDAGDALKKICKKK